MKKIILKSVLTIALVMLFSLKSNAQVIPCSSCQTCTPCDDCQDYSFVNHTDCPVSFFYWYSGCNLMRPAHLEPGFTKGVDPLNLTEPDQAHTAEQCAKCPNSDDCACADQINIIFGNGTQLMYGPSGFMGSYPTYFYNPTNGDPQNQIGNLVSPNESYSEVDLQTDCGCPPGQGLYIQAWEDVPQSQAVIAVLCK